MTLRYAYPRPNEDMDGGLEAQRMPDQLCELLAGSATRLHTLDVEAVWSPALAQLCRSLPALRTLRLDLLHAYWRDWGGPAAPDLVASAPEQAVALLRELGQVNSLTFSVDSSAGSDDEDEAMHADMFGEEEEDEEEEAGKRLPSLAGIPNLHGLEVRQRVLPPADWKQLTLLRRLELRCNGLVSPEDLGFGDSLSQLSSLTHLRLGYGALPDRGALLPAVCTLPALRSLHCVGKLWSRGADDRLQLQLPPAFTQLRLRQMRVRHMPLSEASKRLLEAMPRAKVKEEGVNL
ncbi:hypothetical protein ABPG75_010847 [Micractinium tetrahymenae]